MYGTLPPARVGASCPLDCHPKLSSSLGELAINSQVEVLTLAVYITEGSQDAYYIVVIAGDTTEGTARSAIQSMSLVAYESLASLAQTSRENRGGSIDVGVSAATGHHVNGPRTTAWTLDLGTRPR